MKKLTILAVAVMLLAPAAAVVLADTATTAPTTATAPAATAPATSGPTTTTSAPTSEPTSMPATTPVVTVGDKTITVGDVNAVMAKVMPPGTPPPAPERRMLIVNSIIQKMMFRQLQHAFVVSHKLQPDEKELAKTEEEIAQKAAEANVSKDELLAGSLLTMDDVRDELALRNFATQLTSDDKVKAYIEAHPSYFDGTELRVSHILVMSSPLDATKDQLAARQKLEGIAKEINDGKISFADSAKANGEDATKETGGDLGAVKFDLSAMETGQGMDPSFVLASFNTEKGKVSPVFRTQFGWHIVQITEVKPGTGKPAEGSEAVAKQAIIAEQSSQVLTMSLKEAPIVYPSRPAATTTSAPASQPATATATAPAKAPTTAPATAPAE